MDYITSRSLLLPKNKTEMSAWLWFNLWVRASSIQRELILGDRVYWYETSSQALVWETTVRQVDRTLYTSKSQAADWLKAGFGISDETLDSVYFREAPASGFCLAWRVKAIRRMNAPKPQNFRFPQQGWLRVDNAVVRDWVGTPALEESATLDLWVENQDDVQRGLEELNERMKELTPERVQRIVNQTIRKDTAIVQKLKEASQFRCQFPSCDAQIRTKQGGLYIEVAHIQPVAKGGQSTLGNLLVLCPNHHKEFDHGALAVEKQTPDGVSGTLNGRWFEITLNRPGTP